MLKDTVTRMDNPQNGKKYLQITHLIKDQHEEYIKNYNSTAKKPNNPVK